MEGVQRLVRMKKKKKKTKKELSRGIQACHNKTVFNVSILYGVFFFSWSTQHRKREKRRFGIRGVFLVQCSLVFRMRNFKTRVVSFSPPKCEFVVIRVRGMNE